MGTASGSMGMWIYENFDREKVADGVYDLILCESESKNVNSLSYLEEPGSGSCGKYDKPVLT